MFLPPADEGWKDILHVLKIHTKVFPCKQICFIVNVYIGGAPVTLMCFGSRASSRGTVTLGRPQLRVHIGGYIALVFSVLAAAQEALVPGE